MIDLSNVVSNVSEFFRRCQSVYDVIHITCSVSSMVRSDLEKVSFTLENTIICCLLRMAFLFACEGYILL